MMTRQHNMTLSEFKEAIRQLGFIEHAEYAKVEEIAEFLGVSRRQVYRLLSGERPIPVPIARMLKLAKEKHRERARTAT